MQGVDLDAVRQIDPGAAPFTYRLGGHTFAAVRTVPTEPLASAAVALRSADDVELFVQMVGVIFTLTESHQHRRLRKVLLSKRDPITPDIVAALYWLLLDHFTPGGAQVLHPEPVPQPEPEVHEHDWAQVINFARKTGGRVNLDG